MKASDKQNSCVLVFYHLGRVFQGRERHWVEAQGFGWRVARTSVTTSFKLEVSRGASPPVGIKSHFIVYCVREPTRKVVGGTKMFGEPRASKVQQPSVKMTFPGGRILEWLISRKLGFQVVVWFYCDLWRSLEHSGERNKARTTSTSKRQLKWFYWFSLFDQIKNFWGLSPGNQPALRRPSLSLSSTIGWSTGATRRCKMNGDAPDGVTLTSSTRSRGHPQVVRMTINSPLPPNVQQRYDWKLMKWPFKG